MMLSICMMTYNHEKYISQAIESVLMQKCNFDFELIIGEDHSTDNTKSICESYANLYSKIVKPIFNEQNLGPQANFISIFNKCQGKYIALLEGDDYWTNSYKLQKQVDFLESHQEFSICFHKVHLLKNGKLINDKLTHVPAEETTILDLAKGNYIHTPTVVFRNGLIKEFPTYFMKAPIGDYILHMLNAKFGKIRYFEDVMGVYRIHEKGLWSSKDYKHINTSILNYLELMVTDFPTEVQTILINRHSNTCWNLIKYVYHTDKEMSYAYFVRLANLNPQFLYEKSVKLIKVEENTLFKWVISLKNSILRH